MLEGVVGFQLWLLLPGRLPHSRTETELLRSTIHDMSFAGIMTQLFRDKEIPFETLQPDDWLCVECTKEFIKRHFFKWWLDHKPTGTRVTSLHRIIALNWTVCSVHTPRGHGRLLVWLVTQPMIYHGVDVHDRFLGWDCTTLHRFDHAAPRNVSIFFSFASAVDLRQRFSIYVRLHAGLECQATSDGMIHHISRDYACYEEYK